MCLQWRLQFPEGRRGKRVVCRVLLCVSHRSLVPLPLPFSSLHPAPISIFSDDIPFPYFSTLLDSGSSAIPSMHLQFHHSSPDIQEYTLRTPDQLLFSLCITGTSPATRPSLTGQRSRLVILVTVMAQMLVLGDKDLSVKRRASAPRSEGWALERSCRYREQRYAEGLQQHRLASRALSAGFDMQSKSSYVALDGVLFLLRVASQKTDFTMSNRLVLYCLHERS